MADSIKATPRNEALAWLAAKLRGARDVGDVVQVPVLGGLGSMFLGKAPEELTEWSYGNAPMTVPEMTRVPQFKRGRADSFTDFAFAAQGASPLAKIAERGAMAAGRAGERLAERVVPQVMERGGIGAQLMQDMATGSRSQVVKPKGGNWLTGSVERAIEPMKRADPGRMTEEQLLRGAWENTRPLSESEQSMNRWLENKLAKYIRNEMATPEDPLRALAERGVTHIPEGARALEQVTEWIPETLEGRRAAAGFPRGGMSKTTMGQGWEQLADEAIHNMPARMRVSPETGGGSTKALQVEQENPWLLKVPPETMTYGAYPVEVRQELGFEHLADELRNAINPASGLPENLRWKYQDLDKVTVPQAVQRVADINAWRAANKAEADMARAMGPATHVFKEYPEQGFKWVELKAPKETGRKISVEKPEMDLPPDFNERMGREVAEDMAYDEGLEEGTREFNDFVRDRMIDFSRKKTVEMDEAYKALEDALKYEGETMGHCVGGYCPDVVEGRSKIFSLRDKKGQPHVTIETRPMENYELEAAKMKRAGASPEEIAAFFENPPQEIVQIKGKANRAPNPEYLPAVQDFVRSGKWSKVGDLQNVGLIPHRGEYRFPEEFLYRTDAGGWEPLVDVAKRAFPDNPEMQSNFYRGASQMEGDIKLKSSPELGGGTGLTPGAHGEGFALGGLVQKYADDGLVGSNIYNSDAMQDPASAYRFADGGQAGDVRAYADGGLVANSPTADFDPDRIDAIVGDLNALNAG